MQVRNRLCSQVQVRLLRSRVGARGGDTSGRPHPSQAGSHARGHHAVPAPWCSWGQRPGAWPPDKEGPERSAQRLGTPAASRPLPNRLPALSARRPRRPSSLPAAFLPPCTPSLSPSHELGTGYLSGWDLGWRLAEHTGTQAPSPDPSPAPSPPLRSPAPPSSPSSCHRRAMRTELRRAPLASTSCGAQIPGPSPGGSLALGRSGSKLP